jgi:4-amino-4-deoxy-L-arabinose transferase-like glycosyltransferase
MRTPLNWVLVLLGLLLVYFLGLQHLDTLPLVMWDEAHYANNALEAWRDGHWWPIRYEGKPDFWNLKPPLLVWAKAGLMYVLGPSVLAVRLPTVLFGLLTLGLLAWGLRRFAHHWWPGVLAGWVLWVQPGYNGLHGLRTGDFDVPLMFCILGYTLAFSWAFSTQGFRTRAFALGVGAVLLGFWFKTVAVFLPGLGLVGLVGALPAHDRWAARTWAWVLGGLAALGLSIGLYFWLHEAAKPGYWAEFQRMELGRYKLAAPPEDGVPGWRLALWNLKEALWGWGGLALVPAAWAAWPALAQRLHLPKLNPATQQLTWLCVGNGLVLVGLLVLGNQINAWYHMPAYCLWAVAAGLGFWQLGVGVGSMFGKPWAAVAVGLWLAGPSAAMIRQNHAPKPSLWIEEQLGVALTHVAIGLQPITPLRIWKPDYQPILRFYAAQQVYQRGLDWDEWPSHLGMENFPAGHYLLVYHSNVLDEAYHRFGPPLRTYTTAPDRVFYLFYHAPAQSANSD